MIDYLRRLIKFLIYIAFFFVLLLGIIPVIIEGQSMLTSLNELLAEKRFVIMAVLLLAYSLVYPLVNFIKEKRYLNGSFSENQAYFEEAFQAHGYTKVSESGTEIVYRKKSGLMRAMYFWEDRVVLDTAENPVIMSGMRKSVRAVNRSIEQAMIKGQSL